MKKNWTMRVALLIVALSLITSCFVSGTFAKYVTGADADDTARVAKFGVTITSSGYLFDDTYKRATDNTPGGSATTGLTVVSSTNAFAAADLGTNSKDPLVAPGTKNTDGITFTVTGKPEVNVAVRMSLGDNLKEVFLKEGKYADMTTAAEDTFDLDADYYPVIFTLTVGGTSPKTYKGTLADIQAALDNTTSGAFASEYAANTDLSTAIGNIKLTWEWAFNNDTLPANKGTTTDGFAFNDWADTLLGDLAADKTLTAKTSSTAAPYTWSALTEGTDFCIDEVVDITLYIVQVD